MGCPGATGRKEVFLVLYQQIRASVRVVAISIQFFKPVACGRAFQFGTCPNPPDVPASGERLCGPSLDLFTFEILTADIGVIQVEAM